MKKITLLLSLICLFKVDYGLGQTKETRKLVTDQYVSTSEKLISSLQQLSKETKTAWAIAEEKKIAIRGVDAGDNYYELVRFDEEGFPVYKTTFNKEARITGRVDDIKKTTFRRELKGDGMIIGVLDGAVVLDNHQEFVNRITNKSSVLLRGSLPDFDAIDFDRRSYEKGRWHATHVCGTIISQGVNELSKGVATHAKVLSYTWVDDFNSMLSIASEGVLVSNHSYGLRYFDDYGFLYRPSSIVYLGAYSRESYNIDLITNEKDYYQPVFAAGNDGDYVGNTYKGAKENVDMLGGYALAKNAIVVAAVNDVPKYVDASSVKIASFSSQGPSNDFRIKPDISANGVDVLSPVFRVPTGGVKADPKLDLYGESSGTSMATPVVTGIVSLWQQWAIKNNVNNMPFKSATIRAIMAHTADEAGSKPGPDHIFGWGLINAAKGVQLMESSKKEYNSFIVEGALKNEQVYTKNVEVGEDMGDLVVTLSWTDLPPLNPEYNKYRDEEYSVNNPVLVNDLDLVVIKDGVEYFPWKLNKSWEDPQAIKGNNDVDNIEKIEIMDIAPGVYTIMVSHKNQLQVKKSGDPIKQDFSLTMSLSPAFDVKKVAGVDNKEKVATVIKSLWPNPVSNLMNVKIAEEHLNEDVEIAVYDMNGKMVYSMNRQKNSTGLYAISMDGFPQGVYLVEVNVGGHVEVDKVVKN
ncbi:S8 family serine peptidase [Myroides pelagicus]|uniref:S8 family serine peptidase n=1 Tax=Myroides pelagicus TaxID=270914 RepID=UPI002DB5F378|nr:S8 family serine peptidase [Myroides pelagicus]MEC4115282.1 S8 family serine peptidase [Myroides pelagicus]